RPRDGGEDVAADRRPVEGEIAQVGERGLALDDRAGGLPRPASRLLVEVVAEADEALDAERAQVLARNPRALGDEHERPVTFELKRLREHALELELVDE